MLPVLRCKAADALTDAMAARRNRELALLHLLDHLVPPDRGVGAARDDGFRGGSCSDDRSG